MIMHVYVYVYKCTYVYVWMWYDWVHSCTGVCTGVCTVNLFFSQKMHAYEDACVYTTLFDLCSFSHVHRIHFKSAEELFAIAWSNCDSDCNSGCFSCSCNRCSGYLHLYFDL